MAEHNSDRSNSVLHQAGYPAHVPERGRLRLDLEQRKRGETAVIHPRCVQDFAPGYKEFTIVTKAVFGGGYKIFWKQREYQLGSKEYILKWVEYSSVLYTTAEEAEKDFKRVTGNPTVLFTPSGEEEK